MSAPEPMAGRNGAARTVVVTGASSGIGAAVARTFGKLGWTVAIGARRMTELREVGREVDQAGGHAFVHALDVTKAESIEAFFAAMEAAHGAPDVVVSNAGIGIPGLVHELAVADIQRELATNLLGPMLVVRRALPAMLARRRGDFVFISSMNVSEPRPFQLGYTASKAGVEGMAHALRMDLEGTGLRSVIVRPGPTCSEFGAGWGGAMMTRVIESWNRRGFLRHHQFLDGEDVAAAVVAAVTAPRGMSVDVVQVNPEGPRDG